MKKALYFGSFNPLHIGHMAIANYVLEFCGMDSLTLVLTPANPLKDSTCLADAEDRLRELREAVGRSGLSITVSDIEFSMTPPLYTVNTLERIVAGEPDTEFHLVMGADNLAIFDRWYRHDRILELVKVLVYPRAGHDMGEYIGRHPEGRIIPVDAPIVEVSSTMIREGEAQGKNMNGFRYR